MCRNDYVGDADKLLFGGDDRIQKAFEQLTDRSLQQMEALCGHLKKLVEMAEGYEEAEKENELVITNH